MAKVVHRLKLAAQLYTRQLKFQVQWTADCTKALTQSKHLKHKYPLKKLYKRQTNVLAKLSGVIRNDYVANIDRSKIATLIVIEMHARDVTERLYKSSKQSCNTLIVFGSSINARYIRKIIHPFSVLRRNT